MNPIVAQVAKKAVIDTALSGVRQFTSGNFRNFEGGAALVGQAAKPTQMGYSFNNAWGKGKKGATSGDVTQAYNRYTESRYSPGRGFGPAPRPEDRIGGQNVFATPVATPPSASVNFGRQAITVGSREATKALTSGVATGLLKSII